MIATLRETRLAEMWRSLRFHYLRRRGRTIPMTLALDVQFDLLKRGVRILHREGAHEYEGDVVAIANAWADAAEDFMRGVGDYETLRGTSLRMLDQVERVMIKAGVDVTRSGW